MLCTMCMHGTTDTWKCDKCGETHCRHMMWKCPDCGATKPGSTSPTKDTSMILAIAEGVVVGALPALEYLGADNSYPFGWKELREKVPHFDVVDCEVPVEQAERMVEAYNPARLQVELHEIQMCNECSMSLGSLHLPHCGKRVIGCPEVVGDDCE